MMDTLRTEDPPIFLTLTTSIPRKPMHVGEEQLLPIGWLVVDHAGPGEKSASHPLISRQLLAASRRAQNRSHSTDGGRGIGIHDGNGPEAFDVLPRLDPPGNASIGGVHNCSLANRYPVIRIRERDPVERRDRPRLNRPVLACVAAAKDHPAGAEVAALDADRGGRVRVDERDREQAGIDSLERPGRAAVTGAQNAYDSHGDAGLSVGE